MYLTYFQNKVNVTKCPYFNADGNGAEIWDTLRHSGELKDVSSRGIGKLFL